MGNKRLALGSMRDWHLWLGVLLALPILIVAITTIFLAHKKSFEGPGAAAPMSKDNGKPLKKEKDKGQRFEPRALLPAASGQYWVGAGKGLYLGTPDGLRMVDGIGEVRDLHAITPDRILVASRNGLWMQEGEGTPEHLETGDWAAITSAAGRLFVAGRSGIKESADAGLRWQDVSLAAFNDVNAYLETADGVRWIASKAGLYRQTGERAPQLLQEGEVLDLALLAEGVLAAGKNGLWLVTADGSTQRVGEWRDLRSLVEGSQGLYAAVQGGALFADRHQPTDFTAMDAAPLSQAEPASGRDAKPRGKENTEAFRLDRLMKTLHTGKFLGPLEWLWGDIVGGSMILFTMTGLVMWWRGRGGKLRQAHARGL